MSTSVFASSFGDGREVVDVGAIKVMRDAPGRKRPPRKHQFFIHGVDPEQAVSLIRQYKPVHWGLSVVVPPQAGHEDIKEAYKRLGYRLLTRLPYYSFDLADPIERPAHEVRRIVDPADSETIRKAARQRQIPEALLGGDDQPIRLYAVFQDDKPVGWVQSRRADNGVFWVANLFVLSPFRSKGIGASLMRQMLLDDRAFGGTHSVLLATSDGSRLYRKLGYEEIGMMMLFSPVRR